MNIGDRSPFEDETIDGFDLFGSDDDGELELTCPGCDHRLSGDAFYHDFRVCPKCRRHFWIPARERIAIVADPGSFRETNGEVISIEPLILQDTRPSIGSADSNVSAGETVVTGMATIGGRDAVLLVVDMAMTPGSLGIVAGERICLAFDDALRRRIPLIVICSGSSQTERESLLTFAQQVRIGSEVGRLQRAGIPMIAVMMHPTTGVFFTGIGNQASVVFAEPGAQLGLGLERRHGTVELGTASSEQLLGAGLIDGIVERTALHERLVTVLDTFTSRGTPRSSASPVWTSLPRGRASDDSVIARTPSRPTPHDYLEQMQTGIVEIHGDRSGGADPNLIAGFGRIEGVTVALVGTRSAPLSADGFRTLVRLYRLAGQLEIPVVSLIDAPGTPDIDPIQGAILSNAIAQSIRVAVSLPVPTISVITGNVSGPGGMALAIADTVLILEHALLAGGADRQRPPGLLGSGPGSLWNARECLRLGVVDGVIPEPAGGAQADPSAAAQQLRLALVHALAELASMSQRRLLDERYRKLRHLGVTTPAGREALHIEIAQLRELQQTLGRSIEELRGRLEIQQLGLPNLPSLPARPTIGARPTLPHVDLSSLPTRPSLPVMRRAAKSRPEMTQLAERFAATRRTLAERMHDVRSSLELDDYDASKEPPIDG